MKMLTFHQWKDAQVKKDSKDRGVGLAFREKEWYYSEYGKYCNKWRRDNGEF